jgi:hypothetical protein
MERDINLKFEDIYTNIDKHNEKYTKKLLNEPSSDINQVEPFFCSYFCNSFLHCCCFFLYE